MEFILGIDDKDTKLKSKRAKVLNELPSTSEIKNANEIELQSMTENTIESVHIIDTPFIDDGATNQFNEREMFAFDKEIKRIDDALKVAVAKKIELKDHIKRENNKLKFIEGKSYEEEEAENIKDAIIKKRNELKERNEEITILKNKFSSQITQIKESVSKLLDEDTPLGERIKTLFKEQGITIVSILTTLGFIISTIVESAIPGSTNVKNSNNNNNNPNKKVIG